MPTSENVSISAAPSSSSQVENVPFNKESPIKESFKRDNVVESYEIPSKLGISSTWNGLQGSIMNSNTSSSSITPQQRYDYLCNQVTQLNSDLHKAAVYCDSLKSENENLQLNYNKLKDEVIHLNDKYNTARKQLYEQTEQKIQSDRKHENIVRQWKKQLDQKAQEFQSLQRKLAPPKDLDMLRIKIQEELETPHQHRIKLMQEEIEKYKDMFFNVRREYELIKTEYDQFAADQGNEMQVMHEIHQNEIEELKRIWDAGQETVSNKSIEEKMKLLECDRNAIQIELCQLKDEIKEAYLIKDSTAKQFEQEKLAHELQCADLLANLTTSQADIKSLERQTATLKDEVNTKNSLIERIGCENDGLKGEVHRLKEHLQQKDMRMIESNNMLNLRFSDVRNDWEKERSEFKEEIASLNEKLSFLQNEEISLRASLKLRENEYSDEFSRSSKLSSSSLRELQDVKIELEQKLLSAQEEIQKEKELEKEMSRKFEKELETKNVFITRLEKDKETLQNKLSQSQEVINKLKLECLSLRSKQKEMDTEYRILQNQHRDILEKEHELELEKEEYDMNIRSADEKYNSLLKSMEMKNYEHENEIRTLKKKVVECTEALKEATEISKKKVKEIEEKAELTAKRSIKKSEAYKRKLLELHEEHKLLKQKLSKMIQDNERNKKSNMYEMRKVLERLNHYEHERDVRLHCSSPSFFNKVHFPTSSSPMLFEVESVLMEEESQRKEIDKYMNDLEKYTDENKANHFPISG